MRKETQYDRELRKAVGLNGRLTVRDFYGGHMASDQAQSHVAPLRGFIDVNAGDYVFVVSFKWKSHRHKMAARAATRRLMAKFKREGDKIARDYIKKHGRPSK